MLLQGGLAQPNKAPSPSKLKHYQSVNFCQFLECQTPLLKTFWRQFCVVTPTVSDWRHCKAALRRCRRLLVTTDSADASAARPIVISQTSVEHFYRPRLRTSVATTKYMLRANFEV